MFATLTFMIRLFIQFSNIIMYLLSVKLNLVCLWYIQKYFLLFYTLGKSGFILLSTMLHIPKGYINKEKKFDQWNLTKCYY